MASLRGTIVERANGRYTAVTAPVTAPDGRKRRFSLGTFPSREEALRRLADHNSEISAGQTAHRLALEAMTLAEYLNSWVRRLQRAGESGELARRTVDDYQASVRLYLVPELGGRRIRDLDAEALEAFKLRLKARGLSDRTVLKAWRALHKALADARLGWNPCAFTKPPRVRSEREVVRPTPEEIKAFLEHARSCDRAGGSRLYAFWRLIATTGLRRGEACAVAWEDLDLDHLTLRIRRSMGISGGGLFLKEPKSRSGRRTIGLDRQTADTLAAVRQNRLPERLFGLDLVFRSVGGDKPLNPNNVTFLFRDEWRHAGGRGGVTLHSLRHAHGSALIAAGLPVPQVAAHLGHDPHVLLSIYARELSSSERIRAVTETAQRLYGRSLDGRTGFGRDLAALAAAGSLLYLARHREESSVLIAHPFSSVS